MACTHLLCTEKALKIYGCSFDNSNGSDVIRSWPNKHKCCVQHYRTAESNRPIIGNKVLKMKDKINIKSIGVVLFVLASVFCIYEICVLENEKPQGKRVARHLKLVHVFSRHGDRAPSDSLPEVDSHREKVREFWPYGLTNLTKMGRIRELMLGMETRRHYNKYLDYNSSKIMALSSPMTRCHESLELFLKGLYNMEWTKDHGISLARKTNCTNCLPHGSGFPEEWKKATIDFKTVPALSWAVLDNCKFRKDHPSPIDSDLMASPEIRDLNGIYMLKDTLLKRYTDRNFSYSMLSIWSTVTSELNLVRTESTINYTNHYRDWINLNVSVRGDSALTLYDLFEQASVIAHRDRVVDEANYIQSGPLITSVIESQMMALGMNVTNDRAKVYKDKKMIIYMTHDTILQLLFSTMGIIHGEGNIEDRFHKMSKSSEEAKFLASLKMCSYGFSSRFELWEQELEGKSDKFPYVQVSVYNKEDPRHFPMDYKTIEFGSICRRIFLKKYKKAHGELAKFYNSDLPIDQKYSCPFKLLRNITADFMIDDKKIEKLCN